MDQPVLVHQPAADYSQWIVILVWLPVYSHVTQHVLFQHVIKGLPVYLVGDSPVMVILVGCPVEVPVDQPAVSLVGDPVPQVVLHVLDGPSADPIIT